MKRGSIYRSNAMIYLLCVPTVVIGLHVALGEVLDLRSVLGTSAFAALYLCADPYTGKRRR
jgi:hypothetical protein